MASKEKINELRQLIERVPVLRVYINQTPDLGWILTSDLTAEEINEKIRAETRPPVLYKEVPCSGLDHDQEIIVTSNKIADELIVLFFKMSNNGNN